MSHPPAKPNPDVSHDLGKLLKRNPRLFNVLQIGSVRVTGLLRLELDVVLASTDPVWGHVPHAKINCINAVDYAIRPKPPEIIEGGKYVQYYEEHPRLLTVSQCVPHSDGMECHLALDEIKTSCRGKKHLTVVDPSCGVGSFLAQFYGLIRHDPNSPLSGWVIW